MTPRFCLALLAITLLSGQTQEAFDAASIKLNQTGSRSGYPGRAPGNQRFTATNLPLMALIMLAYDVTPDQVSGVPLSFTRDGYDVDATCEHPITKEQCMKMLQALLADRFKLTLHRETREQSIYALVVGKRGPKFEDASQTGGPDIRKGKQGVEFKRTPMTTLTIVLSQLVGRRVVDQTGLRGSYDFTLQFAPPDRTGNAAGREAAPNADGLPSVFTAVQEQLGLKLESQKGPVEFVIVDHAEKPTVN